MFFCMSSSLKPFSLSLMERVCSSDDDVRDGDELVCVVAPESEVEEVDVARL